MRSLGDRVKLVSEAVVVVIEVERVEAAVASFEAVDEIASVVAEAADDVSGAGEEGLDGVSLSSPTSDTGREGFGALSGVVFVGAESICCRIRSGTVAGVTWSMNVKAGRRRIVVGAEAGGWSS